MPLDQSPRGVRPASARRRPSARTGARRQGRGVRSLWVMAPSTRRLLEERHRKRNRNDMPRGKDPRRGARRTTRSSPRASVIASSRRCRRPTMRSSRCSWSMASTAAVGSLIATDNVLSAISASPFTRVASATSPAMLTAMTLPDMPSCGTTDASPSIATMNSSSWLNFDYRWVRTRRAMNAVLRGRVRLRLLRKYAKCRDQARQSHGTQCLFENSSGFHSCQLSDPGSGHRAVRPAHRPRRFAPLACRWRASVPSGATALRRAPPRPGPLSRKRSATKTLRCYNRAAAGISCRLRRRPPSCAPASIRRPRR